MARFSLKCWPRKKQRGESASPSLPAPSPIPTTTSAPAAEASAASTASDALSSPSHGNNPWDRAYQIVQKREPELMADYKTHLASEQGDDIPGADLFTPRSVEVVVQRLAQERETKQWRVSLGGKDIKIREQAENLVKFLLWSDPFVKTAVNSQPYAALAWSGVQLLLPVCTYPHLLIEPMLM